MIAHYDTLDKLIICEAFQKACETAYKAVMKPKEGTILTVAKGAADKALELSCDDDYSMEEYLAAIVDEAGARACTDAGDAAGSQAGRGWWIPAGRDWFRF